MSIRLASGKLTTLGGAAISLSNVGSEKVAVRSVVPELTGSEPQPLTFDAWRYRLVLRVSPTQLVSVLRTPVLLAAAPNAIGGDVGSKTPGIRLRRGAPIRLLERRGAAAQVELSNGRLPPIIGWIPDDALGTSFVPQESKDWDAISALVGGAEVVVSTSGSLLLAPRGKELVKLSSLVEQDKEYGTQVARKGNAALVLVRGVYWMALGWISASVVESTESEEGGVEGGLWDEDPPGSITLAKGTPLFLKPGGEVIGWVSEPHSVVPVESTSSAHRLRLFLSCGELEAWVAGPLPTNVGDRSLPPPPPPPPAPPTVVPPAKLEANRIAGDRSILPDPIVRIEIERSGKIQLVSTFKVCVDASGAISALSLLKSSGFPGYDAKLKRVMLATWRYSPYLIDGVAKPVCTAVTFITPVAPPPPAPAPAPTRKP